MAIERTSPMWISKRLVINCLRRKPEDLEDIFGHSFDTTREAIDYLEKHPGDWYVGGELLTDAEAKAKYSQ